MPTICWKIFPAKTKKMLSPGNSSVTMRSSFKSVPSQNTKLCVYYRYFLRKWRTSVQKLRAQVQGLKESRLTIRDDDDQDPVASEEDQFRQGPSYSLHRLVCQSAVLQEIFVMLSAWSMSRRLNFPSEPNVSPILWTWYWVSHLPNFWEWFLWNIWNGAWHTNKERLPFQEPGLSSLLGLTYVPIVENSFPELAVSFLDFSTWIPPRHFLDFAWIILGTFSILIEMPWYFLDFAWISIGTFSILLEYLLALSRYLLIVRW